MSNLYASRQESTFHTQHSTLSFLLRKKTLGGYCGGVPPLPIPNREVKPACADGTAMQCGRVGGCLLYFRSSESNDFGDLFLFRRVWHPAIPTPPPMVRDSVGIAAHPINQGDYAYSFVSLKRKNFISVTPLKAALNALILALNDSAKALVALLTKKFKTSS